MDEEFDDFDDIFGEDKDELPDPLTLSDLYYFSEKTNHAIEIRFIRKQITPPDNVPVSRGETGD